MTVGQMYFNQMTLHPNFSPMERKDSKKHKRTQSLKKPKKSGGEGAAPAVPPKPVKITIL
jgi:hypothetical protein